MVRQFKDNYTEIILWDFLSSVFWFLSTFRRIVIYVLVRFFLYLFIQIAVRQSAVKQHVELPVYDHNDCKNKYRALGISVNKNQVCAGGVFGFDTCDGDSGNPLMKVLPTGWVVEAIVSFGRGCGLEDFPAVYTRVSNYENWIRTNLRAWNGPITRGRMKERERKCNESSDRMSCDSL